MALRRALVFCSLTCLVLQEVADVIEVGAHHFVNPFDLDPAFGNAPHVALVLLILEALAGLRFVLALALLHLGSQRHEHLDVDR